jgi:hypothetical protein
VSVVAEPTAVPVPGALVSLQRESGARVGQTLTDEAGRATLRAPEPGSYRLRADRIGYQGLLGQPFTLGAVDTISVTITMPSVRVLLPELRVTSSRSLVCRIDRESGTLMAALWGEVRKALTGAELTRTVRQPMLELTTFERDLDLRNRVTREASATKRGASAQPFVAADPARLIERGFVESRDGETWYYGPDANLLLSDEFSAVHCFRVVQSSTTDQIGLAFEPIRGRKVPEIEGTLWVDRATAELRTIEYRYRNLGRRTGPGEGGRIEYSRLPTGGWIVSDWTIRMPVIARLDRRSFSSDISSRDSVIGIRETGGRAEPVDPEARIDRSRAVLTGRVFDSTANRGLEGVVVSIGGRAYQDTTDGAGRYRIETPTRGDFLISYEHPRFDALGLSPRTGSAQLDRGRTATVDLTIPSFRGLRARCGSGDVNPKVPTLLAGIVRDSSGRVMAGGQLELSWTDQLSLTRTVRGMAVGRDGKRVMIATDQRGAFQLCGSPPATTIFIRSPGSFVASPHSVRVRPDTLEVVDLTVTVAERAPRRSGLVVVVRSPGGAPVTDALAALIPLPGGVRTDPKGTARFVPVPAGRFLLDVRALGYQTLAQEVEVADRDTITVEVSLTSVAQELAPLEVKTAEPWVHPMLAGFEERRKAGFGRFVTREILAQRENSALSDVLRMNGVRLVALPQPCKGFAAATARGLITIQTTTCMGKPMPAACFMALFVDGILIYQGGEADPPNLDEFRVNGVEAVEVYRGPAELPTQYNTTGAACGAVLIWRRVTG